MCLAPAAGAVGPEQLGGLMLVPGQTSRCSGWLRRGGQEGLCLGGFSSAAVAQPPRHRDAALLGDITPPAPHLHRVSTRVLGTGFFWLNQLSLFAFLHLAAPHLALSPQVFPDPEWGPQQRTAELGCSAPSYPLPAGSDGWSLRSSCGSPHRAGCARHGFSLSACGT